jgi:DHA3 family macrolide efflux protein-like MFS transporter
MTHDGDSRGMRSFLVIWSGQLLSQVGTLMTSLALIFWAYDTTGRATELALMAFFALGPRVLFGPFAGAMIDRWKRRTVLLVCDSIAALISGLVLALLVSGNLQIWHLYVLTFATGLFSAFQEPAFLASATMMVPKRQYGRTGGLTSLLTHASAIVAPAFAGILLPLIGLKGILLVDIGTFLFAAFTLASVRIPDPERWAAPWERLPMQLLRDVAAGFRYLIDHRSLLFILLLFASTNFFGSAYSTLYRAMLLARTGGSEAAVVAVQLLIGIGGTTGALFVAFFGSPKRRMHAILIGYTLGALFRALFGVNLGLPFLATIGLITTVSMAYASGCSNALWQAKVPPAMQGRVLATRLALAGAISLITRLVAGPLADRVFEPAMVSGGPLTDAFGWLAGTGPGAGMGLFITLSCAVGVCVLLWGLSRRSIRAIDTLVPDYAGRISLQEVRR